MGNTLSWLSKTLDNIGSAILAVIALSISAVAFLFAGVGFFLAKFSRWLAGK